MPISLFMFNLMVILMTMMMMLHLFLNPLLHTIMMIFDPLFLWRMVVVLMTTRLRMIVPIPKFCALPPTWITTPWTTSTYNNNTGTSPPLPSIMPNKTLTTYNLYQPFTYYNKSITSNPSSTIITTKSVQFLLCWCYTTNNNDYLLY